MHTADGPDQTLRKGLVHPPLAKPSSVLSYFLCSESSRKQTDFALLQKLKMHNCNWHLSPL